MLIDSHAHLNFRAFEKDLREVISRSLKEEIWIINVGSRYQSSQRAVEITSKFKQGIYAAVGLHPIHLKTDLLKIKIDEKEGGDEKGEEFDYQKYRRLARSPKVVAIGEIGLDYYWQPKTKIKEKLFKEKQKTLLKKQITLAQELDLPIIFHCRRAHSDLIKILQTSKKYTPVEKLLKGVVHCFTGNWNEAQAYLEMGFYLGFNGLIFKKNFEEIIIKKVPLERILLETDCPYLTPPQKEGRNEPLYLRYIAEKIAEIKNIDYKKVAKITSENAKKLFKIE